HVSLDDPPLPTKHEQVSQEPDPATLLAAAETEEAIWAAIEQLSPPQRAAVVLRYYGDMSDAEVARRLALPSGTVRRRLHDARQRLRLLLPTWIRQPIKD